MLNLIWMIKNLQLYILMLSNLKIFTEHQLILLYKLSHYCFIIPT